MGKVSWIVKVVGHSELINTSSLSLSSIVGGNLNVISSEIYYSAESVCSKNLINISFKGYLTPVISILVRAVGAAFSTFFGFSYFSCFLSFLLSFSGFFLGSSESSDFLDT